MIFGLLGLTFTLWGDAVFDVVAECVDAVPRHGGLKGLGHDAIVKAKVLQGEGRMGKDAMKDVYTVLVIWFNSFMYTYSIHQTSMCVCVCVSYPYVRDDKGKHVSSLPIGCPRRHTPTSQGNRVKAILLCGDLLLRT